MDQRLHALLRRLNVFKLMQAHPTSLELVQTYIEVAADLCDDRQWEISRFVYSKVLDVYEDMESMDQVKVLLGIGWTSHKLGDEEIMDVCYKTAIDVLVNAAPMSRELADIYYEYSTILRRCRDREKEAGDQYQKARTIWDQVNEKKSNGKGGT